MSDIDKDRHAPWLAFALDEALKRSLCEPKDVLVHATPEVLVSQLPHDVITALLSRALSSGAISPQSLLETADPDVLAEHLEPDVLWRCLRDVAERAGLSARGASRSDDARTWLAGVLERALGSELLAPADVLRFLPPAEFVKDTPLPVMAELIKNGLVGGKFDPALVLQHLTPKVIAENLESSLVWACITDAATRRFELHAEPAAAAAPSPAPVASTPAPVASAPVAAAAAGGSPSPRPMEAKASRGDEATGPFARPMPKPAEKKPLGRIEPVAPRRPAAAKPAEAEWRADDLDVIDEQPLPPPPAARKA